MQRPVINFYRIVYKDDALLGLSSKALDLISGVILAQFISPSVASFTFLRCRLRFLYFSLKQTSRPYLNLKATLRKLKEESRIGLHIVQRILRVLVGSVFF